MFDFRNQARWWPLLLVLFGLIVGTEAGAAGRSLYWQALDVEAELDREGHLYVAERHAMVFTGAWNGGERIFRVDFGQRLDFTRLTRIDPMTGESHQLREGSLSAVDEYQWVDRKTLRWRSRLPSQPAFNNTELVYVLEYTLSNILISQGEGFLLDHDFAFPDRRWPIRRFSLNLQLDPAWRTDGGFTEKLNRENLAPEQSVVLRLPLRYTGSGRPAGVRYTRSGQPAGVRPGAPVYLPHSLLALLLISIAWSVRSFYRHEKSRGRFVPLLPVSNIDEAWLEKNVFSMLPEVAGAAWDEATAGAEVAAVLARMVQEGKLSSEIERGWIPWFSKDVLHLRLLVDRDSLQDYEKRLIKSLFFKGDTTDTKRIRSHYKSKGFKPAGKIRSGLEGKVKALTKRARKNTPGLWKRTAALLTVSVALQLLAVFFRFDQFFLVAFGSGIGLGLYLFSRIHAMTYSNYITGLAFHAFRVFFFISAYVAALAVVIIVGYFQPSLWLLAGWSVLAVALFRSVVNAAKSEDTLERTLLRKNLASARRYLKRELKKRQPGLKDAWLPYLLAFGLGTNVDRWFRAHGRKQTFADGFASSAAGSSSGSAGRWTGGGGSFGGAGASASWAAAAGSLATGVSAPSSGGSSGGGGGGSSGGGGGGGW